MTTPKRRRRSGMTRLKAILTILVSMIVSMGVGALLGKYFPGFNLVKSVQDVYEPPFDGKTLVHILVLGEDNTGGKTKQQRGLSDTIMLLSIDTTSNRVAALSIPRDTMIDLEGHGECKINAAHVFGGHELTKTAVERLVGIRPDYYIKTNVEGFKKSVDIVGGVEIDVEKNMRYTDRRGGLFINLKKGRQVLDGEKAMQYVRFRHDTMGDITRIQRQQRFLVALAEKVLEPANLPKIPRVVQNVRSNVKTDLSMKDLLELSKIARKFDLTRAKMETLPGAPQNIGGISYWVADPVRTAEVVQELFFPPSTGLPKVEVLNGSGMHGAAQKVADLLRQHGYEIASVGNADSFEYVSSEVIAHSRDMQGLDQIAGLVNSAIIKYKDDASAQADVTVVVGKDCALIGSGI